MRLVLFIIIFNQCLPHFLSAFSTLQTEGLELPEKPEFSVRAIALVPDLACAGGTRALGVPFTGTGSCRVGLFLGG